MNLFVRFLEESEDTKKSFRNYLTFKGSLIFFHFGSNLQKRCQISLLSTIHSKRRCSWEWFCTSFGDLSQREKLLEINNLYPHKISSDLAWPTYLLTPKSNLRFWHTISPNLCNFYQVLLHQFNYRTGAIITCSWL